MQLQRPALSPQDLPGSGVLVGRRYRLRAPISNPVGPGSWLAFDEVLARTVVVQFLSAGASLAAAEFAAVRAASRLTDPRIGRIFDADDSAELPYLVCENAPGQRLDQMLGAGPLDPALAAAIIAEAASALAGAHAAGAPHLCLTPRSLRLGDTGLKITGLAVEAAAAGVTDASPGVADSRALGQILYAFLTGYWLGSRATGLPPAPCSRRGRPYQPWQVRAGIPAALDDIACRALGVDPAHPDSCFADPASLAAALRAVSAVPMQRRRRASPGRATAAASSRSRRPAILHQRVIRAADLRADESAIPRPLGDCA